MADRVLSQEEVDALLRGVSSGAIETEAEKKQDGSGIRAYDLTSQERVIRGRMPTMEIINERFCRLFRITLFNFIRKMVDISMEEIRMRKYGEFVKNLPLPASFNIFQPMPLRGLGLLVFDAALVYNIVDNFFGGGNKFHTRIEGRDFTGLEQRIIRKLVDMVFADMKSSWQAVYPVDFVYNRSEVNPQFVNVMTPSEVVAVMTFKLEIETAPCTIHFCVPYTTIEPIKEKLYAGFQSDKMEVDRRWMSRFEQEMRKSTLPMSCEIGQSRITIQEFLNLDVGDTIQLERKVNEPLTVNVEGIPKFFGMPGLCDGHYAVQISEIIAREVE